MKRKIKNLKRRPGGSKVIPDDLIKIFEGCPVYLAKEGNNKECVGIINNVLIDGTQVKGSIELNKNVTMENARGRV